MLKNRLRAIVKLLWKRRWSLFALAVVAVFLFGLWLVNLRDQIEFAEYVPSHLFEDRKGRFLSESDGDRLGYWDVETGANTRMQACILAIEDHRFWQHQGIDLRALFRAFANNLSGQSRQGASTIAMQVARMQKPGERSYFRKIGEMFIARGLTQSFGREAVLNQYLRIVPMGNRIHGVSYAARRYFHKPLQDLSWAESALLASLPKAPGTMNLYQRQGRELARARARIVLGRVLEMGWIDKDAYQYALDHLNYLEIPIRETRPFHSMHAIFRLQQQADQQNIKRNKPIRASLDLDLQAKVDEWANDTVVSYRGQGAGNVALIVMDIQSNHVLAYVGSSFYDDTNHAGSINYANLKRSTGSTIKPFIFASALASKTIRANEILPDLPLHIVHPSGHYSVSNYDDDYLGPLIVRRALANSRNIPAVEVLKRLGLAYLFEEIRGLGLVEQSDRPERYGLGLAIGGLYCSLEQLLPAYAALGQDGRFAPLIWFTDDRVNKQQVIDTNAARQVTLFLSDPQARLPSFPRMGPLEYPFPVAVKTGTSQGFRDAWCVAYSDKYVVGAWLGDKDWLKMNRVGGLAAAGLVHKVMSHLHPQESRGIQTVPFKIADDHEAVTVCGWTGLRATSRCGSNMTEYFEEGSQPVPMCGAHVDVAIDRQNGQQAESWTPAERVVVRESLALPPEYAVWADRRHLAPPPQSQIGVPIVRLAVQTPTSGSRVFMDPEIPRRFQSLALRAEVEPRVPQIEWWVDGELFSRSSYPYEARWPILTGQHVIVAKLPHAFAASEPVSIFVD